MDGHLIETLLPSGIAASGLDYLAAGVSLGMPSFDGSQGRPEYIGMVDPLAGTVVSGWSVSRLTPGQPAELAVQIDGVIVAHIACNHFRPDLASLGLEGKLVGFRHELDERFLDGRPHTLKVVLPDGGSLSLGDATSRMAGRMEFTVQPTTRLEGFVDGLSGNVIRGWAVRHDTRSGAVSGAQHIRVFLDDLPIADVVADQSRLDVARHLDCDAKVGFQFVLPPQCRTGQEFYFTFKLWPEEFELRGSPARIKYEVLDRGQDLRELQKLVDDLCVKAWSIQRTIRDLSPVQSTVSNYGVWGQRYHKQLRGRLSAPTSEGAPLVSIIMPTFRPNLAHFAHAIESVRSQTHLAWELHIVDDGSNDAALTKCIEEFAKKDSRIKASIYRRNRGISAATNAALRKASGRYVVFFDHDDLLTDVAIEVLVREALITGASLVYADEDKIDEFGVFSEPNLKPDWNYRLLLGVNYICHPVLVSRELVDKVGMLRSEYDGAQDHDFLLRLSEHVADEDIRHVPEILYHWRKSASSTAGDGAAKPYAVEAGRAAIEDHLGRRGFERARVSPHDNNTAYSVSWGISSQPSVTIIIPFRDQAQITAQCVNALLDVTAYPNFRIVLVDNGSTTAEAARFVRDTVQDPRVVVLRVDEAFNYSRLNNLAAREYPAEFYLFLNNDVIIAQDDWLQIMVDEASWDKRVAIVGSKLIYPNGTVQHGGVVLGIGGVADHAFKGIPAADAGYLARAWCAQQYSAVTAACMLCRADVFMAVGGFDEHELAVAFNDIDLCLKVGAKGGLIVWTPNVVAEHHESLSRGTDLDPEKAARFFNENYVMLQRWKDVLHNDPFYNPHFSRAGGIFTDLG